MLLVPLLVTAPLSVRVPTAANVPDVRLTPPLTVPLPLRTALFTLTICLTSTIPPRANWAPELMLMPPEPESVAPAGTVKVPLTTFAAPKTERSLPAVRPEAPFRVRLAGDAASCPLPPIKAPVTKTLLLGRLPLTIRVLPLVTVVAEV